MSRTVADAALMLSRDRRPRPRDRHTHPEPDSTGWLRAAGDLRACGSPTARTGATPPSTRGPARGREAVRRVRARPRLRGRGGRSRLGGPVRHFWAIVALESDLAGMRRMAPGRERGCRPTSSTFLQRPWTAEEFTRGDRPQGGGQPDVALHERYDLLLTPTLAVPPFPVQSAGPRDHRRPHGRRAAWLAFTFPFNMTGQPAASIPAGFTRDGLPVGLQIVGRHLDDPLVLRASAAFEAARSLGGRLAAAPRRAGSLGVPEAAAGRPRPAASTSGPCTPPTATAR